MPVAPVASRPPVQAIKKVLFEKWPDACRIEPPAQEGCLRTGNDRLDRLFGPHGLPRAQLLEITGATASGKTRLLFCLLAALTRRGNVIFCDWPRALFPPALHAAGVDLERLWIVRPPSSVAALRQVELLCKSPAVCAAVLDLSLEREPLSATLLHRLRQQAVRSGIAILFLTSERPGLIPPSMISLSLRVQRLTASRVAVTVCKSKISRAGIRTELDFDA